VSDEAAAVLMTTFYQQLQTPGMSRARALQQAQLRLLQQPQYAEPFFWAPFLLINPSCHLLKSMGFCLTLTVKSPISPQEESAHGRQNCRDVLFV